MIKRLITKMFQKFGYEIIRTERYLSLYEELIILGQNGMLPGIRLKENKNRIYLLSKLLGTNPSEGLFIIDSITKTLSISGDICEFGVAQGATSALMANEILNTNKSIWLFDSFQGLPKPTANDLLKDDIFNLGTMNAYKGKMSFKVSQVKHKLREINFPEKRVRIVPGFIEETIKYKYLPPLVSFAYIDFDFYEPIKLSLNFLSKVLSKNAIMIVDDYDFFSTGVKTAVDEFMLKEKGKYQIYIPEKQLGHFAIIKKL